MPPWDDKTISRFEKRVALFRRRGWNQWKAETWADRMVERDFEREDIHCCIECSNLMPGGACRAAQKGLMHGADRRLHPVTDMFQRCEHFDWEKPSEQPSSAR